MTKKLITSLALNSIAGIAFAAGSSKGIPAGANPGNVMNTLNQTLPGATGPTQGGLGSQSNPQKIAHAAEVQSSVVLKEVKISGAEHPMPANVKAVYQAMIGHKVNFQQIQAMTQKMEQMYRQDGYILVQVILPPQEIALDKGIVQVQIIEGHIRQVIFTGDNPNGARTQLERYAALVDQDDPVTYHTLDRFLVLANQLPGIDVSATVVADKKMVGASDLVVNVVQTATSGYLNFNNRGTQYIGPNQMAAGASLYDIFGADAMSIAGATVPGNAQELKYGSFSYDIFIGSYGTEINPSVTVTQTKPGGSLAPLDMFGESMKYNLAVNQPLYTSTPQKLTLQSAFYHTNSYNNLYDTSADQIYNDSISALSLGLDYQGIMWNAYNDFNFSMTQGMPIFGAPKTLSNPSVVGGDTEFTRFNFTTSTIRYVTQNISFVLGTQFQGTPDTLLSSEQIGYGGQVFGQAFTPYVISGDNGAMGSLALRYDFAGWKVFKTIQPQVFYDAGVVSFNHASAGETKSANAESAGLGLNLGLTTHVQCAFTLAKPLHITHTAGVSNGWQAFFNVTGVL